MATYGVSLPITGSVYVEVEANSEEEAIEKALESEVTSDDIEGWETHQQIVQGNVFYGQLNEAHAEEV